MFRGFHALEVKFFQLNLLHYALAAIILQLIAMECQKLHIVGSPMPPWIACEVHFPTIYHLTYFNDASSIEADSIFRIYDVIILVLMDGISKSFIFDSNTRSYTLSNSLKHQILKKKHCHCKWFSGLQCFYLNDVIAQS